MALSDFNKFMLKLGENISKPKESFSEDDDRPGSPFVVLLSEGKEEVNLSPQSSQSPYRSPQSPFHYDENGGEELQEMKPMDDIFHEDSAGSSLHLDSSSGARSLDSDADEITGFESSGIEYDLNGDDTSPLSDEEGKYDVLSSPFNLDKEKTFKEADELRSHRNNPMTREQFQRLFDISGRLVNEHELRRAIFKGGIDADIRKDVWTFLFELYPFNSTARERESINVEQIVRYEAMKVRWKKLLKTLINDYEGVRYCPKWYSACPENAQEFVENHPVYEGSISQGDREEISSIVEEVSADNKNPLRVMIPKETDHEDSVERCRTNSASIELTSFSLLGTSNPEEEYKMKEATNLVATSYDEKLMHVNKLISNDENLNENKESVVELTNVNNSINFGSTELVREQNPFEFDNDTDNSKFREQNLFEFDKETYNSKFREQNLFEFEEALQDINNSEEYFKEESNPTSLILGDVNNTENNLKPTSLRIENNERKPRGRSINFECNEIDSISEALADAMIDEPPRIIDSSENLSFVEYPEISPRYHNVDIDSIYEFPSTETSKNEDRNFEDTEENSLTLPSNCINNQESLYSKSDNFKSIDLVEYEPRTEADISAHNVTDMHVNTESHLNISHNNTSNTNSNSLQLNNSINTDSSCLQSLTQVLPNEPTKQHLSEDISNQNKHPQTTYKDNNFESTLQSNFDHIFSEGSSEPFRLEVGKSSKNPLYIQNEAILPNDNHISQDTYLQNLVDKNQPEEQQPCDQTDGFFTQKIRKFAERPVVHRTNSATSSDNEVAVLTNNITLKVNSECYTPPIDIENEEINVYRPLARSPTGESLKNVPPWIAQMINSSGKKTNNEKTDNSKNLKIKNEVNFETERFKKTFVESNSPAKIDTKHTSKSQNKELLGIVENANRILQKQIKDHIELNSPKQSPHQSPKHRKLEKLAKKSSLDIKMDFDKICSPSNDAMMSPLSFHESENIFLVDTPKFKFISDSTNDNVDNDPQISNRSNKNCPYCNFKPDDALSVHLPASLGDEQLKFMSIQAQVFAARQPYNEKIVSASIRVIDKDVPRTDRELQQFKGDDNPGLLKLRDALLTYSFFHPDVGYAQGMNDIMSRFLVVMDSEAEAYWMFVNYMEHFKNDFMEEGMLRKIVLVEQLLMKMDRELYDFLQSTDIGLMFCHRWLLLNFKREFAYLEAIRLFEITSSRHLEVSSVEAEMERSRERAKDFVQDSAGSHLEEIYMSPEYPFDIFVCVAMLVECRKMIMETSDINSVYQVLSNLPTTMDLQNILRRSEELFYQYCRKSVVDCFQVIDELEVLDFKRKKSQFSFAFR